MPNWKEKVLAIYDAPDYRRMSIPKPDQASGFVHPIDFKSESKIRLGGLYFQLEPQGWGHTFHPMYSYDNPATKLFVMFAKEPQGKDKPEVPVVDYTMAKMTGGVTGKRIKQLIQKIVKDLKRRGYSNVHVIGEDESQIV